MEGRRRGKIEEEVIDVGLNKEEEKLEIECKAVKEFYFLLGNKDYKKVFDSIIKGG